MLAITSCLSRSTAVPSTSLCVHHPRIASGIANPGMRSRSVACAAGSHKVTITQRDGSLVVLDVPEGTSVLEAAIDANVDLPHDCKMGVCMTCPAKLTDGSVDQSAGMLSEDVKDKGYCLLCVAMPQSDCSIEVIEEEELLNEVMVG